MKVPETWTRHDVGGMYRYEADVMLRPLEGKTPAQIIAAREGGTYQLQVEDEAGKKALFELTAKHALHVAPVNACRASWGSPQGEERYCTS